MKKILLTLFAASLLLEANAQTTLTFESHGLVPNHQNPMLITSYVEPGNEGKNVAWDFSALNTKTDFTGSLQEVFSAKGSGIFNQSNTVLEEFGNYFFFETTKDGIKQHGFVSGNGATTIQYTTPFEKMRYPFKYGDSFAGDFGGIYSVNGKETGTIKGTFEVTADGVGTLILPNGIQYPKALRVKEVKNHITQIGTNQYSTQDITYRWYVSEYRFPILVLIKSTHNYQNGQTSSSTKAAFNPVILSNINNQKPNNNRLDNDLSVNVYPNPYKEKVYISYMVPEESMVNVSVYDLAGKLVATLANTTQSAGEQTITFSAKEQGFATGAYLVKVSIGNKVVSKKILEL